jgi:hypothetical protein
MRVRNFDMSVKHGHVKYLSIISITVMLLTLTVAEAENLVEGNAKAELEYVPALDNDTLVNRARRRQDTTLIRPQELRDVPADTPKEPVYFMIRVGDKDVPGITYRSTDRARQFKLCLDTNGNGLLSDEKQYVCTGLHKGYKFGPVSTRYGNTTNRAGVFYAEYYPGRQVEYYPVLYRQGQVVLDGKAYKIALLDCDYDGKYNEPIMMPPKDYRRPECDVLAMDLDGDSKFDSGQTEIMPLSNLVKVNEQYYSIQAAEDGSIIEFGKARPQFGTLDVGDRQVDLSLLSDTAYQQLSGSSGKWNLPAGKYCAVSLKLTEKDSAAKQWTLKNTSKGLSKLSNFEIRPGETTSLQIGGPLQIKATMERNGEDIMIGFDLEGQAGELYAPCAKMNGTNVPEPEFKIFDGSEQVVHSGRFKYG